MGPGSGPIKLHRDIISASHLTRIQIHVHGIAYYFKPICSMLRGNISVACYYDSFKSDRDSNLLFKANTAT